MNKSLIIGALFALLLVISAAQTAEAALGSGAQNDMNLTEGNSSITNISCTTPVQVDTMPQAGSCIHYQINCTPWVEVPGTTGVSVGATLNATEWYVYDNSTTWNSSGSLAQLGQPLYNITIMNGTLGDMARPYNGTTVNTSRLGYDYITVNFTGIINWNITNATQINITFCLEPYAITKIGYTRTSGAVEYTTMNWTVNNKATDLSITSANITVGILPDDRHQWDSNYSSRYVSLGGSNITSAGSHHGYYSFYQSGTYNYSITGDLNSTEYLLVNWTATQSSTSAPSGGNTAPPLIVSVPSEGLPGWTLPLIIGVIALVALISLAVAVRIK